ncbi:type IV pilus twitching motility protein PilT [Risungbinella massiliensis]|uniref:type IV pilus twitching motility protein PilT n=1 Tax=Risungbinella massiliensis TaxID=1329796 RepID=UPI0005CC6E4A|nr:PilT/PilU family type 4a pilus ATPase [Risungbinella massiliensis]
MTNVIPLLLSLAYGKRATDLHIVPNDIPRARVGGQIIALGKKKFSKAEIELFLAEHIPNLMEKEFPHEVDFSLEWQEPVAFRTRVHLFQASGDWRLSFRLLPTQVPSPHDLGLAPVLLQLIKEQSGLILFTGPTGSGKTTSLASLIQQVNQTYPIRIITLEDPIEYHYPAGVSMIEQREIGVDTTNYSQGIYASLRQDPDVIVVGELRELDAMEAALRAAEAGKLVLATMHASRALQAITRYIGSFPDGRHNWIRSQLANVLLAVINQRLIPSSEKENPVLVQEVLVGNPAVRNLIRSNQISQITSVMETGHADGMQTMEIAVQSATQSGKLSREVSDWHIRSGVGWR